jgi:hypothetical protein
MPDILDMELDARPTQQDLCPHNNIKYQPREWDTNVLEDYYCLDCNKQFELPEPDEDIWRDR